MTSPRLFSATKTEVKPVVRFYFDFDGTLTSMPGGSLVFTPFYNLCVGNYNEVYTKKYFNKINPSAFPDLHLSADVILEKLKDKNNNPHGVVFEMRPASVSLLKYLLSDNNDFMADIHIVSKNISEYIIAVIKYHGFTDDELAKLSLHDTVVDKKITITNVEQASKQQPVCVFAFDDSETDLTSMSAGCSNAEYADENIHVFLITREGMCQYQHLNQISQYDWHNLPSNISKVIKDKINQWAEESNTPKSVRGVS